MSDNDVGKILSDLQDMADGIAMRAVEIMEDPAIKALPEADRDRIMGKLHSLHNRACTVRDLRAELEEDALRADDPPSRREFVIRAVRNVIDEHVMEENVVDEDALALAVVLALENVSYG